MTPPEKRPVAKGRRADVADLAFEKARQALMDEKTRAMLLAQCHTIAEHAQRWRDSRRANADGSTQPSRLGEQFGQGKLERRVENLAASLDSLTSGQPDLAGALDPVGEAITRIRVSVEIAGRLPVVKRKQAHLRIDRELDRLERSLFDASLPAGPDDD